MRDLSELTPVFLVTRLAEVVFSVAIAQVVGPYIVIATCAMGGAGAALMESDSVGRWRALGSFFCMSLVAVVLTVPAAIGAAALWEPLANEWTFAPISFGLGYMGNKWGAFFKYAAAKANSFIDLWIASRSKSP